MTIALLAGCWSFAHSADESPPTVDAAPAVDEVVVTGERSGPGMWHVHRGTSHLWILGSISPLPRDITWRSNEVEHLLDSTSQVLIQKPFEIGVVHILWLFLTERSVLLVGGGKRLKDVMPADLYARFSAERSRVGEDSTKWERYRPLIAAAFLQQAAFHQVNLSMRLDLGAALRVLAKEHHVPVEEVKFAGVDDMLEALKTLSPATERICVEASLTTIETGLPRLIERARAWAGGNVEKLENLPELKEVDACRMALDGGKGAMDAIAKMRGAWLSALEKALQGGGTTVAVVNLDLLLESGGLLDELRGRGYDIDAP